MEEWSVSEEARNPRNDYPELIKPVDDNVQKSLIP
jgi:hypothetical protein